MNLINRILERLKRLNRHKLVIILKDFFLYVLINNDKVDNEQSEKELILKSIDTTKINMHRVYNNLDAVTDPDLIDSCIYELKSIQLRYRYLINRAKEMNIYCN